MTTRIIYFDEALFVVCFVFIWLNKTKLLKGISFTFYEIWLNNSSWHVLKTHTAAVVTVLLGRFPSLTIMWSHILSTLAAPLTYLQFVNLWPPSKLKNEQLSHFSNLKKKCCAPQNAHSTNRSRKPWRTYIRVSLAFHSHLLINNKVI
jgi:hypothetical protein